MIKSIRSKFFTVLPLNLSQHFFVRLTNFCIFELHAVIDCKPKIALKIKLWKTR
jgi:hypothetical protein